MRTYTVAEAAAMAGIKPRTLQFWTMNDVILCDPATRHGGPGVRRQYETGEVAIAAVLGVLSQLSLPVGQLKEAAKLLRNHIYFRPYQSKADRDNTVNNINAAFDRAEARAIAHVTETLGDEYPGFAEAVRNRLKTELEQEPITEEDYFTAESWSGLWDAIERRIELLVNFEYMVDRGWRFEIMFRGPYPHEHLHLDEVPEKWGVFFVINTKEVFARLPQ